jgi:hypothetical protein
MVETRILIKMLSSGVFGGLVSNLGVVSDSFFTYVRELIGDEI